MPERRTSCADPTDVRLEELVRRVAASAKHGQVTEALIRRVGARELAVRPTLKEAVKATQRKLHQVGAAYSPGRVRYADWLARLRAARDEGDDAFRTACLQMMRLHASTRERLPILARFFEEILADLAPVRSVIDVACGLGPLAIPWMPLGPGATYHACDVYEDLAGFLQGYLPLAGVRGLADARDVISNPPGEEAQVALVLKFLPCAEQLEGGASLALLDALRCTHLLVSFPAASLGGRHKGMAEQYEATFREMIAERPWQVQPHAYAEELAFLVTKGTEYPAGSRAA